MKESVYLTRFYAKTKPATDGSECLNWTACTQPNGYGKMSYKYRTVLAHRWIYEQMNNVTLPPDVMVLHSCDNRACVNLEHLRPGSAKDNMADMDARGRRNPGGAKGVANVSAKLTEDQVRGIRAARDRGWPPASLPPTEARPCIGCNSSLNLCNVVKRYQSRPCCSWCSHL
jgi:hypothetical protein